MSHPQPNNPLHGVTLEKMLVELSESYGWDGLAQHIDVRCFSNDPSIKSCLRFFRQTPWARAKLESLYLHHLQEGGSAPGRRG
ncbi:VF530 family DNA-binding protein [Methylogaea oryzae]|uniref:Transporter n=1 Tax=Methylogaea oryzae TaxID=1295382 RepID=A0A8D5AJJ4_9GAMM|nr:VF530 family protein [Methylogaea oryzae]BBL70859.1 transporter [Methylogaea oryzae]